MSLRKVLLLTYHFPPSGAVAVYRMLGLVRYLPKFGWQPVVVAPPRVVWEPEDASLLTQVPAETPIERVPFPTGFVGKLARYCAPESHWLWPANRACRRMIAEHQPAAIVTSSPPGCVHLLGMRLSRRHRLPWLADFRDPWVTNHSFAHQTWRLRWERWLEAKVMRRATTLIANTPLNREGWASAFPEAASKMVTITNGFDPERFVGGGLAPRVQTHSRSECPTIRILHAGELYHERDPRPLLDALRELQLAGRASDGDANPLLARPANSESLPVQLEFIGRQSGARFDLSLEIRNRHLENDVRLEGMVPYAEALQRMLRADIMLLINSPGFRIGVPAKLYEYLGAGRPILALAEMDSDVAWVLRESGVLHRIAPPRDVATIKQALVELVCDVQAGTTAVPNSAALQQFTRERMAQKFAECLDRSVGNS